MSIADWLERVHQQPHEHRRRLMWVSVAGTLLVVGFFWALFMKYELKVVFERARNERGLEQSFKQTVADKAPTLGDTLKASVQDFLSIFNAPAVDQSQPAEVKPPALAPLSGAPAQNQPQSPPERKFLP